MVNCTNSEMAVAESRSGSDGNERIPFQMSLGNMRNLLVCGFLTLHVRELDHRVDKGEMVLSPWLRKGTASKFLM